MTNFVEHEQLPGVPETREGTRQLFAALHAAFPDLQVTIDDIVSQGDRVVCSMTWQGTHTGEFMGIPPTGTRPTWKVLDIVRFADGKAVEHWGMMDQLSLMRQLGVIPVPDEVTH